MSDPKTSPLVSIVLTTLNAAQFLRESVNSCLTQAHSNIELIVVDGGSTDGTLDILESYTDPRMRIVHQEGNAGRLPGAINLGLDRATGDYLTWMQADSRYARDATEQMVRVLEDNPEVGQVYADFYEMDSEGHITGTKRLVEPKEFLQSLGDPGGVCFLIRRKVREEIGPHDISTHPCHDYDYRMRIALRYPSYHIAEPLYYWRYHDASLTGQIGVVALARQDVEIRLQLGLDTPAQARQHLAEIEMAHAFECYQQSCFEKVPRQVWEGLRRNPHYTRNLGVWSILIRSLIRMVRPTRAYLPTGRP